MVIYTIYIYTIYIYIYIVHLHVDAFLQYNCIHDIGFVDGSISLSLSIYLYTYIHTFREKGKGIYFRQLSMVHNCWWVTHHFPNCVGETLQLSVQWAQRNGNVLPRRSCCENWWLPGYWGNCTRLQPVMPQKVFLLAIIKRLVCIPSGYD